MCSILEVGGGKYRPVGYKFHDFLKVIQGGLKAITEI